jgi:hypothetical protein
MLKLKSARQQWENLTTLPWPPVRILHGADEKAHGNLLASVTARNIGYACQRAQHALYLPGEIRFVNGHLRPPYVSAAMLVHVSPERRRRNGHCNLQLILGTGAAMFCT